MAGPYVLTLTSDQRAELRRTRDHHPKPYVRERAACILKVADGHSIRAVARAGGLRPHRAETVKAWIGSYLHQALPGLLVRQGRGRKPAFSPSAPASQRRA